MGVPVGSGFRFFSRRTRRHCFDLAVTEIVESDERIELSFREGYQAEPYTAFVKKNLMIPTTSRDSLSVFVRKIYTGQMSDVLADFTFYARGRDYWEKVDKF